MYITNNIYTPIKKSYRYNNKPDNKQSISNGSQINNPQSIIRYSEIPFGAIYNVKVKKVNIDAEKNKMLRQISEMLETNIQDTDFEDAILNTLRKALYSIRAKVKKQEELIIKVESLYTDKTLNPQQKLERINQLKKAAKQLESNKTAKQKPKPEKVQDERIDYQLLNKFKTAIGNDDFNLQKILKDYYQELNSINTIEELTTKYPKIKIPRRPEEVVAEKIESVLTKDFYLELDRLYKKEDGDNLQTFLVGNIIDLCQKLPPKYNIDKNFYKKILTPTIELICKKYATMYANESFSAVPEQRKIKVPQISETDMKMLSVDFEDFVLHVVRNHYLDMHKLNEITYSKNGITLSVNELKISDYKFEKMSEKVKKFVTTSATLHAAQRDYQSFDIEQLKSRLNYFANSQLSDNEDILKNIIDFDACNFTDEDISLLVKFLKELDLIKDGEKPLEEGLQTIHINELRPKGTEKLNEQERLKATEKIKAEQQKIFKLNILTNSFDEAINILYQNNLNNIANTCSKYRPKTLNQNEVENAEYIIKTINQNISANGKPTINKFKLESNISRWDTYNYYKNNDATNPIFIQAQNIAKNSDGEIDIDKAGQYIINSEIVNAYPESLEFVKDPDIVSKIIEKTEDDNAQAIEYLAKLDTYNELNAEDKTHISTILNLFDTKDSIDKIILKYIIENNYIKTNTTVLANIHKTSDETIPVKIDAKAKKAILDKYKYPTCIEYLSAFEDALSSFATESGTSGIKRTARNNKTLEYKMELKIKGHDDRLFSSKNDYCFDIFSDRGMH